MPSVVNAADFETSTSAFDLAFRTTRIFRFMDRHWRQVHHHGSIDDPALLDRYQSALNSLSAAPFAHSSQSLFCA